MWELLSAFSPPSPLAFSSSKCLDRSARSLPISQPILLLMPFHNPNQTSPATCRQSPAFPFLSNLFSIHYEDDFVPAPSQCLYHPAMFWPTFAQDPLPDIMQHQCDPVHPRLFDPFPAAKISCSPLPHPQRAYKFRVSNLFMDSLSVVQ